MYLSSEIANHIRGVYFGGNWTDANFRDCLQNISWQQATTKVHSFNTIATLVFHTSYFIAAVTQVLKGNTLQASDKLSFSHPPITCQQEWDNFINKVWEDVEVFASLIEELSDEEFWKIFSEEKYGNYYSNLTGIIEHSHYHLGQIVLIKKILVEENRL